MAAISQTGLSAHIIYSVMVLNDFIVNNTRVERHTERQGGWGGGDRRERERDLQLLLTSPADAFFFCQDVIWADPSESSNEV